MAIESASSSLPDLYDKIKKEKIRGILSGKKDDYLNSLIGFVCRPDKKPGDRWEITYHEWEAKLGELNARYNKETRQFPRKYFVSPEQQDSTRALEDLFVKKIQDIEYRQVIVGAIRDYEATVATIDQEFRAYAVDPGVLESYSTDVVNRFSAGYRIACRRCSDEIKDSQDLFDQMTSLPAAAMPGFGDTPDGFRNGLLHLHMNDEDADLVWRVKKV